MSNIRDLKKITTMKACKWTRPDITGPNPSHADSPNPQRHTGNGKGGQNNGRTANKQVDRVASLTIMA